MEKTEKQKIEDALKWYLSMSKLNDTERQGWLDWNIKRERIESVGEHTFDTIQLAIAIWSEFDVPVNIDRVGMMLNVHETEEPIIGDISLVHKLKEYKKEIGKIAVEHMTSCLTKNAYVRGLINEYEEQKTPESKFAKFCDKLQCDIESKLNDEENTIDLNHQENNLSYNHPLVQKLLSEGKSFSEMWMEFGRTVYNYPEKFNNISEYAEVNDLHELRDNNINKGKQKVKEYLDEIIK